MAAVKEKLAGSRIISAIEISDVRIILNRGYDNLIFRQILAIKK